MLTRAATLQHYKCFSVALKMLCRSSCGVNHANTSVAILGSQSPGYSAHHRKCLKCCTFTDKYLWFGLEAGTTTSKNIFLSSKEKELELLLFPFQKLLHPSTLLAVTNLSFVV